MSNGVHKRLDLAVIAAGRLPVHLRHAGGSGAIGEDGADGGGGGDGGGGVAAARRVGRDLGADERLGAVRGYGHDAPVAVDQLRVHVAVGQVEQQQQRLFTGSSNANARHNCAHLCEQIDLLCVGLQVTLHIIKVAPQGGAAGWWVHNTTICCPRHVCALVHGARVS